MRHRRPAVFAIVAAIVLLTVVALALVLGGRPTPTESASTAPESSATTSATASSPSTAVACTAERTITESWDGGFKAEIVVTRSDPAAGWTLTWNADSEIQSFWGGNWTADGAALTVTAYDATDPGATITLGYVGSGTTPTSEVSDLAINGQECLPPSAPEEDPTSTSPSSPSSSLPSDDAATEFFLDTSMQSYAAWQTAKAAGDSVTAALLEQIATQPQAHWLTDALGEEEVRSTVTQLTSSAGSETVLLVVYAIPGRDCGQYSSGGLTQEQYVDWVAAAADGIQGQPWIVLEPDALAMLGDCEGQGDRVGMLAQAARILSDAGARVYLDVGHSNWLSAQEAARRLQRVGLDHAVGFALNVSNYQSTADSVAYAAAINQSLGTTAHFIVDTSRNGNGAQDTWCNPQGAALGESPRIVMDDSGLDAVAWIKLPGGSDGTCNGGPAAGQWWQEMALRLVQQRG